MAPAHAWALLHDGDLVLARDRRTGRTLMYAALTGAGLSAWFINVTFAAGVALKFCGLFLAVGGTISLAGHWKRHLVLEKLGFPLLVTAMGALALTAFVGGRATPPRYFVGSLLAAFTFSLCARWRDLQTLVRLNRSIRGGGAR